MRVAIVKTIQNIITQNTKNGPSQKTKPSATNQDPYKIDWSKIKTIGGDDGYNVTPQNQDKPNSPYYDA